MTKAYETVSEMSLRPLQTVTLPVLIDAQSPEEANGWGTCFPAPNRTRIIAVKVVTASDVKRRLPKIFPSKKVSPLNEKFLYLGADMLRRAYEARDEWALEDALKKVHPWVPAVPGEESTNPDADKWEGARWDYSSLMSNVLQNARLVMWWTNKEKCLFSPGVYCPDAKTAAFVMLFLGSVRVCPYCRTVFVPSAENVQYCSPAHAAAYRVEKSRWRARQRKAQEKEKERHGD